MRQAGQQGRHQSACTAEEVTFLHGKSFKSESLQHAG
jgi:hypothetical protein